ncbi:MAG: glycosyltransferase family 87 protein [Myxococcota bacterium]
MRLIVASAILWHLLAVFGPPKAPPPPNTEGRDYASYYYAAKVAAEGGDPYEKSALESVAAAEGTRADVHPFFYPPPFLWFVSWSTGVTLQEGFWLWFMVNELALIASCFALIRWWRSFGPMVAPTLAVVVAASYAVSYSAELGQANFPVLLLIILGLGQDAKRPWLAGILVGLACMAKMSPALLVVWWIGRRNWVAVGAAIATAIVSSVLTLPLLPLFAQLRFYTDVLPQFGSGDYNGLTIKIEMFGNHSIPNVLHQYFPLDRSGLDFPSGENRLSPIARALSGVAAIGIVGGLGAAFRRVTDDPVQVAAQACAVLVAMLLIPVYTYEHHLVFAIPGTVLALVAVSRGWLGSGWIVPVAVAAAILAYDLPSVRAFALRIGTDHAAAFFWIQEAKFAALVLIGAAMVRLGGTAFEDRSRAPAPTPAVA